MATLGPVLAGQHPLALHLHAILYVCRGQTAHRVQRYPWPPDALEHHMYAHASFMIRLEKLVYTDLK